MKSPFEFLHTKIAAQASDRNQRWFSSLRSSFFFSQRRGSFSDFVRVHVPVSVFPRSSSQWLIFQCGHRLSNFRVYVSNNMTLQTFLSNFESLTIFFKTFWYIFQKFNADFDFFFIISNFFCIILNFYSNF